MEFSFKTQIHATKEQVWKFYADIQKWYVWESDLKNITLNGEFETGTSGSMELEGMPPLEYELTSVIASKEFWDKTDTPMGSIYFGHEIMDSDSDFVEIKHTVRLESEILDAGKLQFLRQVFADVPDAVMQLKEAAEHND